MPKYDAVSLLQDLIRCPSVTPAEGGALELLETVLSDLGFTVERITFSEDGLDDVENLYARYGNSSPHFMFAGHTDVVPVGDEASWTKPPFSGDIIDGEIYGRGAVDMKGGIACFIAAFSIYLNENPDFDGSVSLLITGDEEGVAINGTDKLLKYAHDKGEVWDACIVGEPTNPEQLGDMIKIGRRGSLSARVTVDGIQGHVAYPHLADNPIRGATMMMAALMGTPFDEGTNDFPPTNLEVTTVDVGNKANNVIAQQAAFQFNIRFNNLWTEDSLRKEVAKRLDAAAHDLSLRKDKAATNYRIEFLNRVSPVFLTKDDRLTKALSNAIAAVLGAKPQSSTTGGTSDARFIKDYCPVVEFGLVGQTMHMVDERARVADVEKLTEIYHEFLKSWFS
ncbi:succinyl-diaminopimelate desuccinylase [Lentilitoribacter sp. Alg239-R112]|uniref:succinyl-diaminopimelate desuccinylase n=1 Tax=Lentilitoribacter sp. Alg239-R112 TaxID=2305987 RepID=UPI0013A6C026|nr:succinyl-diaminopimelate desuccinylase [Lentilitoribacter sp. Alg239-R112]